MSLSLKAFDEKIADLKQKKLALEAKQAQHLSKYLSNEIGESFSPQLAACVVQDTWQRSAKDQKEKWLKAAQTFQFCAFLCEKVKVEILGCHHIFQF